MNTIKLSEKAVRAATISAHHLAPLNNIVQEAINPIAEGTHLPASLMGKDAAEAKRHRMRGRMQFLAPSVWEHTVARGITVMDSLQALRVLLTNISEPENRTGGAPLILARSALDAASSIAHHLDGDLERRLLQGFASHLGELQQAILANPDNRELQQYLRDFHEFAEKNGYTLNTHDKATSAGTKKVLSVTRGSVTANVEPNTTDAAKKYGRAPFAETQWRYTSGITHARTWVTLGLQQMHKHGDETGDAYLTATATAWQAATITVTALGRYTGSTEPTGLLAVLTTRFVSALNEADLLPHS